MKKIFSLLTLIAVTITPIAFLYAEESDSDLYTTQLRNPKAPSTNSQRTRSASRWLLGLPGLPWDAAKAGVDPTLNYIEDSRLVKKIDWFWQEIKSRGFYPEARFAPGSFISGAGLKIQGETLFRTQESMPYLKYDVTGGFSKKGSNGLYRDLSTGYMLRIPNNDALYHASRFYYNYKPLEHFYGIGHNTSLGDKTLYSEEETKFETKGGYEITENFKAEGILEYRHINIGNGHKEDYFRIKERFSESEVPGIHGTNLFTYGLMFNHDTRDSVEDPLSGGYEQFKMYLADDISGDNFHYLHMKFDGARFFQLWSDRRVLVLRLAAGRSQPIGDGKVPFFDLQRLGGYGSQPLGSEVNRAFVYNRFFDKTMLVFTPEYRYNVWRYGNFGADSVFFVDIGEVFREIHSFGLDKLKPSYGWGLHVKRLRDVFFSFEVAHGNEGTKVYVRTKNAF